MSNSQFCINHNFEETTMNISKQPDQFCHSLNLSSTMYEHYLSLVNRSIFTFKHIRGGADKSLAWPTSRCCRPESIVSLERRVYSCAKLQVFSCYRGWKEACQQHGDTSCHKVPPSCKARRQRKFTPFWNIRGTCTIVCHRQKLGDQFTHGDFSTCDAPRSGWP